MPNKIIKKLNIILKNDHIYIFLTIQIITNVLQHVKHTTSWY